ncbi:arylsulfatase [Dermatobacter hominis]|uniref:arylsulfatase n=1 Tax=Dermatobacter hominis TaxID=2884263 RepID=UPI001D10CA07|nr:arylsulfatase [Dermatobacter hominis]UDY35025.1 arylsulfatase [Dermatobacter hominis]
MPRSNRDPFHGTVGDDWRTSTPWWPDPPRPPAGTPNVLLIVLDDVGFGQLGCYGSDVDTPVIDGLAAEGVRFANFHTTALCSPTRSCLLTGRNHHRNGLGRITDLAMGYPGYDGTIPQENGFLSEILREAGYATYAVGKWHLTPEEETHAAAPRHSWPLGRGFDRWYGFHGGETHQFVPALQHDNHPVAPPASIEDGYHLSADLADRAIGVLADLRSVDPDRPFLVYLATGACHSPHHAPADWIERYRGRFDAGWDEWRARTLRRQVEAGLLPEGTVLPERPSWVPGWDDLSDDERRVAARFMECFAAFLSYTDHQLGRVLAFLDETGDRDDTVVVVVSDNGASAEGGATGSLNDVRIRNVDPTPTSELVERIDELGGPTVHNNYPWGWTMAGNTPFRRWKREVHEGGVADPCIVSWRGGDVERGGVRRQFAHAIDVLPTILDLVGVEAPSELRRVPQSRIDGVSVADLLGPGGSDRPERHRTQHFEMLGSRAIYHDGWKAVTFKPIAPLYDDGLDWNAPFADDRWELYDVRADPTETRDLAAAEPARLAEMVDLWWREARANDVLPLDNRALHTILRPRPDGRPDQLRASYFPGSSPVPERVAIDTKNRGHRIDAHVTIADDVAPQGVLLAQGSTLGGFSFQVLDGRLRYVHNLYGRTRLTVTADRALAPGAHVLSYSYDPHGDRPGGVAVLEVDGVEVGRASLAEVTVVAFNGTGTGLTCGYEIGPAVGEGYEAPFPFDSTLHRVDVALSEVPAVNPLTELERILFEQ